EGVAAVPAAHRPGPLHPGNRAQWWGGGKLGIVVKMLHRTCKGLIVAQDPEPEAQFFAAPPVNGGGVVVVGLAKTRERSDLAVDAVDFRPADHDLSAPLFPGQAAREDRDDRRRPEENRGGFVEEHGKGDEATNAKDAPERGFEWSTVVGRPQFRQARHAKEQGA